MKETTCKTKRNPEGRERETGQVLPVRANSMSCLRKNSAPLCSHEDTESKLDRMRTKSDTSTGRHRQHPTSLSPRASCSGEVSLVTRPRESRKNIRLVQRTTLRTIDKIDPNNFVIQGRRSRSKNLDQSDPKHNNFEKGRRSQSRSVDRKGPVAEKDLNGGQSRAKSAELQERFQGRRPRSKGRVDVVNNRNKSGRRVQEKSLEGKDQNKLDFSQARRRRPKSVETCRAKKKMNRQRRPRGVDKKASDRDQMLNAALSCALKQNSVLAPGQNSSTVPHNIEHVDSTQSEQSKSQELKKESKHNSEPSIQHSSGNQSQSIGLQAQASLSDMPGFQQVENEVKKSKRGPSENSQYKITPSPAQQLYKEEPLMTENASRQSQPGSLRRSLLSACTFDHVGKPRVSGVVSDRVLSYSDHIQRVLSRDSFSMTRDPKVVADKFLNVTQKFGLAREFNYHLQATMYNKHCSRVPLTSQDPFLDDESCQFDFGHRERSLDRGSSEVRLRRSESSIAMSTRTLDTLVSTTRSSTDGNLALPQMNLCSSSLHFQHESDSPRVQFCGDLTRQTSRRTMKPRQQTSWQNRINQSLTS